jgi:hypothetical protein
MENQVPKSALVKGIFDSRTSRDKNTRMRNTSPVTSKAQRFRTLGGWVAEITHPTDPSSQLRKGQKAGLSWLEPKALCLVENGQEVAFVSSPGWGNRKVQNLIRREPVWFAHASFIFVPYTDPGDGPRFPNAPRFESVRTGDSSTSSGKTQKGDNLVHGFLGLEPQEKFRREPIEDRLGGAVQINETFSGSQRQERKKCYHLLLLLRQLPPSPFEKFVKDDELDYCYSFEQQLPQEGFVCQS